MGSTRALLLAGAMALGAVTAAHAADLPPPPPPFAPPPEPVSFGGWYLRGDVGAGIVTDLGIRSTFGQPLTSNPAFVREDLEDNASIGLGVGYQFNNWLRFDVTGEYRTPQKLTALESYQSGGGLDYDSYTGNIQSSVFLANTYIDIGTWYGMTTFVGGGIGASYNRVYGLTDFNIGGIDGLGYGSTGAAASSGNFHLAYAAMAGVDYALTRNLKLEFGYRYLNMGDAVSNVIVCSQPSACERQHYRLASSDIRLGLRWLINDYAPAPVYVPEEPIIRKD